MCKFSLGVIQYLVVGLTDDVILCNSRYTILYERNPCDLACLFPKVLQKHLNWPWNICQNPLRGNSDLWQARKRLYKYIMAQNPDQVGGHLMCLMLRCDIQDYAYVCFCQHQTMVFSIPVKELCVSFLVIPLPSLVGLDYNLMVMVKIVCILNREYMLQELFLGLGTLRRSLIWFRSFLLLVAAGLICGIDGIPFQDTPSLSEKSIEMVGNHSSGCSNRQNTGELVCFNGSCSSIV